MKRNFFNNILILLAILSLGALICEIFDLYQNYSIYLKSIIFATSLGLSIQSSEKRDYYFGLVFMSIALIYNPFFPPKIDHEERFIVLLPCFVFIAYQAFAITQETMIAKTEMVAYSLDLYLRELEGIVCQLSYYQTLLYLKKRYPTKFVLNEEGFSWREEALPDFEFKVNSEFFLPGQNKKGGVSAIGQNKFYSVEIHLNFALTKPVKYTILQRRLPHYRVSSSAKLLKYILKDKYQYVDV